MTTTQASPRLLRLSPFLVIFIAFFSSLVPALAVDGFFAYWRFDEGEGSVAVDGTGNGNDGEIIEPDGVWVRDDDRGSVYESNASSYVDFGTILPVHTLEDGFTWSFWANSRETNNNNIVFGNRWNADGADFAPREFIKFTPRQFEWHLDAAGQNVDFDDMPVDEWVHHLVVKDGDQLTYYRNGLEGGTQTISGAPVNAQPLYLGGQDGRETWSGRVDEVALFDRAISVDEVAEVYQAGLANESLASTDDPNLSAPKVIDFGQVASVPPQHSTSFTVRNSGGENTLTISGVEITGLDAGNFTVDSFPASLGPKESGLVEVTFDSKGETGGFSATIQMSSNDASDSVVEVGLSAGIINLQGPVAHYPLDEAAGETEIRDVSGFNRHGTAEPGNTGTVTLGEAAVGAGTSASFSNGGQVAVPASQFDAFTDFTVSLWMESETLSSTNKSLIGKGDTSPSFAILVNNGALIWLQADDAAPLVATDGPVLEANRPNHVVALADTRAGSRRVALYVNGTEVASVEDPALLADDGIGGLFIGAYNNILGFEGRIDDVQVYDRALTAEEITTLKDNPGTSLGQTGPVDSDGDGLSDDEEQTARTDPLEADTDGDGLEDGPEVKTHGTNPLKRDSDDGGAWDSLELSRGTDPLVGTDDPAVWTVRVVGATGSLTNIAGAEAVLADPDPTSEWNSQYEVINFLSTGGAGNFEDDAIFPNMTMADEDVNLFVVHASTRIFIETGGIHTFGFNSDDGGWLKIGGETVAEFNANRGAQNSMDTVFLSPGFHDVEAMMWENQGGAAFEVFAGKEAGDLTGGAFSLDDYELLMPTQVNPADSDGDGLDDNWENAVFGDLSRDGTGDEDGDGLTNGDEFSRGTNAAEADTDGDSLNDGAEVNGDPATSPFLADTDGDGLEDAAEINDHQTNPTLRDSDGDGFNDGFEIAEGTDPNDGTKVPDSPLAESLLGYWRFEEGSGNVANDTSGNGNHGEIFEPGGAWDNDPDRGTVHRSNSASYVFFGEIVPVFDLENGFAWSFWANSDETSNNNIVFGNRYMTDGADFAPREFIKFTPSQFEWHFEGGGQNVDVDDMVVGSWVHYLVTKNADTLTYYIDGEEAGTTTITGAPENIQPLYIGGQNGVEGWSGSIDEVAVFDRALEPAEVATVYNIGLGGGSLAGGPVEPKDDTDGDGVDDDVEMIAGTDPNDASDYLRVLSLAENGGNEITWTSVDGKTYDVQYSANLEPGSWMTISDAPVASTGASTTFVDTDADRLADAKGYYRVVVFQ